MFADDQKEEQKSRKEESPTSPDESPAPPEDPESSPPPPAFSPSDNNFSPPPPPPPDGDEGRDSPGNQSAPSPPSGRSSGDEDQERSVAKHLEAAAAPLVPSPMNLGGRQQSPEPAAQSPADGGDCGTSMEPSDPAKLPPPPAHIPEVVQQPAERRMEKGEPSGGVDIGNGVSETEGINGIGKDFSFNYFIISYWHTGLGT